MKGRSLLFRPKKTSDLNTPIIESLISYSILDYTVYSSNLQSSNPLHSRTDDRSNRKFAIRLIELAFQALARKRYRPRRFQIKPHLDFMATIELKPKVQFGVVPTHVKFVGGLVPDENGKLPRGEDGRLLVNAELERVNEQSKVRPNCSQTALFPGADEDDLSEMLAGFKDLGLTPHVIMMVAGGNPMDPADEDKIAPGLLAGLEAAKKHGIEHVSSTSLEEWMQPDKQELTGKDFDDAVAQLVKLHTRVCREANVLNSCIKAWHFEFLRGIEFKTFTDIRKAWTVTKAANEAIGQPFFKVLVDAAHCGDSDLSMEENAAVIEEMGRKTDSACSTLLRKQPAVASQLTMAGLATCSPPARQPENWRSYSWSCSIMKIPPSPDYAKPILATGSIPPMEGAIRRRFAMD